MKTVICPKCNKVIVLDNKNFVICCNEVIYVLSDQDVNIFFDEINNPSQPNEALNKAALNYETLINEAHDSKHETSPDVS
jgi:hypothetical protein